ncbi:MAG: hypothetical protein V3V99_12825 [candidate division Zixibacteria bacterium]
MKIKLLVFLLVILFAVPVMALPPKGYISDKAAVTDNTTFIDANRILMFVTNHGNFGRDLSGYFGYDYGTFFPYAGDPAPISAGDDLAIRSPYYAGGLWVGGEVNGQRRGALSEYGSEYVPGPMIGTTFSPDSPDFRVLKLYRDSLAGNPNQDYLDYLDNAVAWGAPIMLDTLGEPILDADNKLQPEMLGDQMCWAIYNDADPDKRGDVDGGTTAPLGLEVKQTVFAFDRQGSLGNIVILKFQIFNKGGNTINDCYFSIWSDPDLGGAGDDLVGCDTLIGLGFVYNVDDNDTFYDDVPCLGIDFFQGPLRAATQAEIDAADPADTTEDGELILGRMWGKTYPDSVNYGMGSFFKYINGTDPDNFTETYAFMQGLDGKTGNPYNYNGVDLKYMHSGDPVADVGDLDINPADRRWMQTTGPVTFAPGDSTEILAAIIVGLGTDRLTSITLVKELDIFAQRLYESGFNPPKPPAAPVVNVAQLPGEIIFTWGDTSEVDPGDFEYEGYSFWQGETAAGPWTLLNTWDVVNARDNALVDSLRDPITGLIVGDPKRDLSNSRLAYSRTVTQDRINGGLLNDVTEYFFRVTAFSFSYIFDDQPVPNQDRFLESQTVLRVFPQSPTAGTLFGAEGNDTLEVTHTGGGDGSVLPIVTDPWLLTGDTYEVTFEDDALLGETVWHLVNVTTGDTLQMGQLNQTGDHFYLPVEGMLIKVLGPTPGVKPGSAGWEIPNGTRRFTWASADFGFEGFGGALGWAGPGDVWGGHDPVDPSTIPAVLLKLAAVDENGVFDPADENVSYAYRYGRGFGDPPALPEFAPFMINGGSYGFQDFEKSCPLSAWNMDVDPPERLAVGYLENNAALAVLDGKYWPRDHNQYGIGGPAEGSSNIDGGGPREWLWIFNAPYSETPVAEYQLNAIDDPMPIMYWATWNRHGTSGLVFEDGDEFLIIPARVNTPSDVFTFTSLVTTVAKSESALDDIKAVPNPFYLFGGYDPSPGIKQIAFHHLPGACTIKIFNLGGDLLRTIDKDDPSTAIAYWDVLTENNLPVASGIYIYVVEAEGYGTKIGKMAVFVEAEVLKIY